MVVESFGGFSSFLSWCQMVESMKLDSISMFHVPIELPTGTKIRCKIDPDDPIRKGSSYISDCTWITLVRSVVGECYFYKRKWYCS